jgi:hypothetical protein
MDLSNGGLPNEIIEGIAARHGIAVETLRSAYLDIETAIRKRQSPESLQEEGLTVFSIHALYECLERGDRLPIPPLKHLNEIVTNGWHGETRDPETLQKMMAETVCPQRLRRARELSMAAACGTQTASANPSKGVWYTSKSDRAHFWKDPLASKAACGFQGMVKKAKAGAIRCMLCERKVQKTRKKGFHRH